MNVNKRICPLYLGKEGVTPILPLRIPCVNSSPQNHAQSLNTVNNKSCNPHHRSQWPCGLRRRSSATRLLRSWVRIPPGAWIFVCSESCVLSGRGLCDGLITRPEESYRQWRVVVCDQETSKTRRLKPATGLWKIQPQWVVTPGKQTTNIIIIIIIITIMTFHSQHEERSLLPS